MLLLLFCKGATLSIVTTLDISLEEGNVGLVISSICVNLTVLAAEGLDRNIVVNVTTQDGTAISKHDTNINVLLY